MNAAIRMLKWLGIIAFALGAIFLLIISNLDSLVRAYDKWTFEHQSVVVEGVYVGMSRSDILFKFGKPWKDDESNLLYFNDSKEGATVFNFDDNRLDRFVAQGSLAYGPHSSEKLFERAGRPLIEAHDNEEHNRRYTYLTGDQEGLTYAYETNKLDAVIAGRIHWRKTNTVSFYAIKGTQVCPGEICPFDLMQEKTPLKEQWGDKTVWDFIDENDL